MYSTGHIDKKEVDQPTTREWTTDDVASMARWEVIADAHNAALDAAYKKGREDEYEKLRKAGCLNVCP